MKCNKCGVILIEGENINFYRLNHSQYICNDCWKKYQREWAKKKRLENPELSRRATRKHYQKHREEILAKQREWCKKNPEKRREGERKYRERHREKYNVKSRNQTRKKWKEVIRILGNSCCICSVIPKKGRVCFHEIHGKEHKENPYYILKHIEDFVPMCKNCHKTLHGFFNNKEKFQKFLELLIKGRGII